MARGSRFAMGVEPRRDADGHSLPSDRSTKYLELRLLCRCHPRGEEPILGAFYIETHEPQFDAAQVSQRPGNSVECERLTNPDGTIRFRYEMRCPKCEATPVIRGEKIDAALALLYEQGAYEKVHPHRV